jgi:cell division protein FtsN
MADDNQASRTFLAIVLGGIVLALVIAAYFMYGHKGETNVKVQLPPSQEQPAESTPPAAETPSSAAEAPADDEEPTEEPSEPPAEESMPPEGQPAETPQQN